MKTGDIMAEKRDIAEVGLEFLANVWENPEFWEKVKEFPELYKEINKLRELTPDFEEMMEKTIALFGEKKEES